MSSEDVADFKALHLLFGQLRERYPTRKRCVQDTILISVVQAWATTMRTSIYEVHGCEPHRARELRHWVVQVDLVETLLIRSLRPCSGAPLPLGVGWVEDRPIPFGVSWVEDRPIDSLRPSVER